MADTADFLDVLQADVAAVLRAVPALAHASIIKDDEGDLDAKVTRALEIWKDNPAGRRGLVLIVLRPEVTDSESNLPGPVMEVAAKVQVIEQVMWNRDPNRGANLSSSQAAITVLSALHLRSFGNRSLYARRNPITSLPVTPGHLSRLVTLQGVSDGIIEDRPPSVTATWDDGEDTLTLTAGGSDEIFYSTDGTFPSSRYTAPLENLATGTRVRAAAWTEAQGFGDVLNLTLTA